jgi:tetratricopeptide (TPR) repeat protein
MDLVSWQDVAGKVCKNTVPESLFQTALVLLFQHRASVPACFEAEHLADVRELWTITYANIWGLPMALADGLEKLMARRESVLFESLALEYLCNLRLSCGGAVFEAGIGRVLGQCSRFPSTVRGRLRLSEEEAVVLLNRGQCLRSMDILDQILDQSAQLDLFGLQTTLASFVLNLISRGMIQRAEKALTQLKQTARILDSDALAARLAYITILLKDASAMQIPKNDLKRLEWEGTKYQLLSDQAMIRNELRAGRFAQAEEMILKLSEGMEDVSLNADVLNFAESLLEIALARRRVGEEQLNLAERALADAQDRSDLRAEARIRMFRGALLSVLGEYGKASQDLRMAVRICEEQGLYFDHLEVLLHRAGLAYLQGQKGLSIGLLSQTLEGYRQAGLRVLELAVTYIFETLERGTVQASFLFRVVDSRHGAQISHFLGLYPFLARIRFSLVTRHGANFCTEADLRAAVSSEHSIFLFLEQGLAIFRPGRRGFVLARMPSVSGFTNAVLALVRADAPLSIVDLHRARSAFPFDPDRHGPSLRSWIARFRQDAEDMGINLHYSTKERGYSVESSRPIVAICSASSGKISKGLLPNPAGQDTELGRPHSAREEFVLKFAREREKFSVSELCQHLSVTRQALNPVLRKLVEDGALILVRRGRSSYYRNAKNR